MRRFLQSVVGGMVGACLVTLLSVTLHAQLPVDLTTQLMKFLVDLRAGVLGVNQPISTITATGGITGASISATGNGVAITGSGAYFVGNNRLISVTAPTISSGFGTSPSIVNSNGSSTFRVNVGTGGVATTGVVGVPTAATGWNCQVTDQGPGAIDATRQTASTTTTVTVGASAAWAASDILLFTCLAY